MHYRIFSIFLFIFLFSYCSIQAQSINTTTLPNNITSANSSDLGTSADANITTDRTGRIWITKPQLSSTNQVRILLGSNFSIGWKFDDSVQVTPANLTLAISTDRRNWVVVAVLPGSATKYTWDTSTWDDVKNGPLLTSTTYTMAIYDERGWDATPMAGYAMANLDLKFQFYSSGDNVCAACMSNALRLQISTPLFLIINFMIISLLWHF